jgi:aspartyl protease family protein
MKTFILTAILLLLTASAQAVSKIEIVALFTGKAVILVDGKRHLIADGEITEEGVEAVRINSSRAILRVDGEELILTLNNRIGGPYAEKKVITESVYKLRNGQYIAAGGINGVPVQFMIDTGASSVAISATEAKRIGIDYKKKGRPVQVSTASHTWPAFALTFDKVRLGQIELRNVAGIVVDSDKPDVPLLGMSFLSQVDVSTQGQVMILKYD